MMAGSLPRGPRSAGSRGTQVCPVDLPHDWLIYNTKDLYEDGIGWYRRHLDYSGNKRVFLYFEGVYMDSSLYVNGTWIGDWKNGYTSFEFEITQALKPGGNEILVRVVHQALTAAGILGPAFTAVYG